MRYSSNSPATFASSDRLAGTPSTPSTPELDRRSAAEPLASATPAPPTGPVAVAPSAAVVDATEDVANRAISAA